MAGCNGDGFPYGPGQQLTQDQIRQLWLKNGGQAQLADVMSAIAISESSGHTGVVNDCQNSGDFSVGLWQINYLGGLLGPRTQRYGSPQQLAADPNAQARAAVDLAGGGSGLGNWSTYTSGAYRANLGNSPSMGGGNSSVGGGVLTAANTTGAAAPASDTAEHCLVKAPSANFGLFDIGGNCLFGTAQARAIGGGGLVLGGAVLLLGGIAIIVSGGKQNALVAGLAKVPGVGWVKGAGVSTSSRPRSSSSARPTQIDRQKLSRYDDDLGAERRGNAQGRPAKPTYPSYTNSQLADEPF